MLTDILLLFVLIVSKHFFTVSITSSHSPSITVPIEWNWEVEEYLVQLCGKAGLRPDCWCREDTKIYRFESEIFKEVAPEGKIVRETLK